LKADTESFTAAFEKDTEAVRFSTPDTLEEFLSAAPLKKDVVSRQDAREEIFFLGLRLNKGVDLDEVRERYGLDSELDEVIAELCDGGLLNSDKEKVHLTERGRLLSNEVFERFIADAKTRA